MTIDEERDIVCTDVIYHKLTIASLLAAGDLAGKPTAYSSTMVGYRSALADRAEELGCLRLARVHRARASRWA